MKRRPGRASIFTEEEDEQINSLVARLPENSWQTISDILGTKTAKQCRDRWVNYINPSLKHDCWTIDEEILLLELFEEFGSSWSTIDRLMPNRSRNDIRYKWMKLTKNDERNNQLVLAEKISFFNIITKKKDGKGDKILSIEPNPIESQNPNEYGVNFEMFSEDPLFSEETRDYDVVIF